MSQYSHYKIVELQPEHLGDCSNCYRQVYGEADAWREFKKCSNHRCGKKWSINQWAQHLIDCQSSGEYVERCSECNSEVNDYWPINEVQEDIVSNVFENPKGIGFVLIIKAHLIGFVYGHGIEISELEVQKEIPGLTEAFQKWFDNKKLVECNVFYQSELGLLAPYQRCGLGKTLFTSRLIKSVEAGYNVGIFRTNPNAMSLPLESKYGYRSILEYEIPGDGDNSVETRVIMAGDLKLAVDIFRAKS